MNLRLSLDFSHSNLAVDVAPGLYLQFTFGRAADEPPTSIERYSITKPTTNFQFLPDIASATVAADVYPTSTECFVSCHTSTELPTSTGHRVFDRGQRRISDFH
jgi:hypothetical protein